MRKEHRLDLSKDATSYMNRKCIMLHIAYCILRDEGLAESLIGDSMSYPNITKEIDGTTITILSVVRDNNSAVIEYTLEKAGGVDALNYSQLDNEAK